MSSDDPRHGEREPPGVGGYVRRRLNQSAPGRAVRSMRDWLLIYGSRRLIALLLLLLVYATLFVFHLLWPFEIKTILTEEQTVKSLLQTLLSGDILLISIVVSINSLVVSQELTPIGDQHEQVVESWNFRKESEETIGDISPATPIMFVRQVCDFIQAELDTLREAADELDDELGAEIGTYVEKMDEYLDAIERNIMGASAGWFRPSLFAPRYDPAEELDQARRIQEVLEDRGRRTPPSHEVTVSFERLIEALQYLATAREYFKTIYYKREFSRLSRDLLYSGLPAIILLSYVLLAIDAETFPGTTFGIDNLFLFISLSYTVALSPFLILTGYVLRAALISENTMVTGGFIIER